MGELKLNLEVFLRDLAAREPGHIDSDDFDFYGEDDSGNECSCSISIVELAQEAADTIAALKDENNTLKTELAGEHYINAELRKEREYFRDESNRLAAELSQIIAERDEMRANAHRAHGYFLNNHSHDALQSILCIIQRGTYSHPAADAYLAELRAQAVEEFAETQKIAAINNDTDQWTSAVFIGAYNDARIYAAQIRAAAKGDNHG